MQAMPRLLVLAALTYATAAHSDPPRARARIVLVVGHGADLGALARAAARGADTALERTIVKTMHLDRLGCWPGDPACAARLAASHRATHVVLLRVLWARAGCVPLRDAAGVVTGNRQLRRPTLEIEVVRVGGSAPARLGPIDLPLGDRAAARRAAANLVARL
jgi:hypothetical protein